MTNKYKGKEAKSLQHYLDRGGRAPIRGTKYNRNKYQPMPDSLKVVLLAFGVCTTLLVVYLIRT